MVQRAAEAARSRSRTFWIVAGLTLLGAVLRFATLGAQSYHHDEIVTASRVLRVGFGHAMNAVGFSESAPPLYYALAWIWTQLFGTGEWGLRSLSAVAGVALIPVAYLIGAELRGRRTGLMAAALVAVNPMLVWYSQEARAYALLVLFCSISLLYCIRARRHGGRRNFVLWGVASALALCTHYFAVFTLVAEAAVLLWRRRREALPGFAIVGLAAAALAPLAYHQMSQAHAEWIGNFPLGHRLWEAASTFLIGETGDIIGRAERPELAAVPLALALAAFVLLAFRADRETRRAVAIPLGVGLVALGIPIAVALLSASKDFVFSRNLIPALVPLLIALAVALTMPQARRIGTALGGALLAYSVAFLLVVNASPNLQRPDWNGIAERVGEPEAPRATVTWTLGEASLRYYLSTDAIQLKASEGYEWLVREIQFVSDGRVPPPPQELIGPRFRESGQIDAGRLFIRRYQVDGPGLAHLPLRTVKRADLNFRTNGVLLDGVGPG